MSLGLLESAQMPSSYGDSSNDIHERWPNRHEQLSICARYMEVYKPPTFYRSIEYRADGVMRYVYLSAWTEKKVKYLHQGYESIIQRSLAASNKSAKKQELLEMTREMGMRHAIKSKHVQYAIVTLSNYLATYTQRSCGSRTHRTMLELPFLKLSSTPRSRLGGTVSSSCSRNCTWLRQRRPWDQTIHYHRTARRPTE
jgi:hypothetical protein